MIINMQKSEKVRQSTRVSNSFTESVKNETFEHLTHIAVSLESEKTWSPVVEKYDLLEDLGSGSYG
mgnify:CR=1 FL=1